MKGKSADRPSPPSDNEKWCLGCFTFHPKTDFYVDNSKDDGLNIYCKEFISKRQIAWRTANRDEVNAKDRERRNARIDEARRYEREYAAANKPRIRRYILKRYGLTEEAFDAMLEAQGGLCAVCGYEFYSEEGQYSSPCVDHDHACCPTDKACGNCIRGLLCHRCNRVIGSMQDDPLLLESAAEYLRAARPVLMLAA